MSGPDRNATAAPAASTILGSLMEGCQVIGFDCRYLDVNDSLLEQTARSRDDLIGRTMTECYPGIEKTAMFAMLQRSMAERTLERMENEFTFPDGSKGLFELRFVPVPEGVCILSSDITEYRQAAQTLARTEEQLRQAQKMEAIGLLAGGIAHDFNNLLTAIIGFTELVTNTLPADDQRHTFLREIASAADRASSLTRQLLAFSRRQALQPQALSLNTLVANMDKLLRRVIGEDVELVARMEPSLGLVEADPGQIEQVILNLAVNARDAMPSGGTLTIETANAELDTRYVAQHVGVAEGPHVVLTVTDSGHGMDQETQARIFEPFFTTKAEGRGTGLGLSTVYGIVKQSGGNVWVYSEVGRGTTFRIYLPRLPDSAEEARLREAEATVPRGTETVLVAEDDAHVRAVATALLESLGYQVLVATNATEALRLVDEHGEGVDLLLTDLVMPGMSGQELASEIRARCPRIRVLYSSGFVPGMRLGERALPPDMPFLQKPYTSATLARKVREVLS